MSYQLVPGIGHWLLFIVLNLLQNVVASLPSKLLICYHKSIWIQNCAASAVKELKDQITNSITNIQVSQSYRSQLPKMHLKLKAISKIPLFLRAYVLLVFILNCALPVDNVWLVVNALLTGKKTKKQMWVTMMWRMPCVTGGRSAGSHNNTQILLLLFNWCISI